MRVYVNNDYRLVFLCVLNRTPTKRKKTPSNFVKTSNRSNCHNIVQGK